MLELSRGVRIFVLISTWRSEVALGVNGHTRVVIAHVIVGGKS